MQNKFKGLSDQSVLIESTIFTQQGIANIKAKLTKAEVLLAEARADYEDLTKTLNDGTDSIQIVKLVEARFSPLLSL